MDGQQAAALPVSAPSRGAVLRRRIDLAAALKEAGLAALIALGLSVPILAFRTDQGPANELILRPRWGLVALVCALVFATRLFVHAFASHRRTRPARPQALATDPSQLSTLQRIGK